MLNCNLYLTHKEQSCWFCYSSLPWKSLFRNKIGVVIWMFRKDSGCHRRIAVLGGSRANKIMAAMGKTCSLAPFQKRGLHSHTQRHKEAQLDWACLGWVQSLSSHSAPQRTLFSPVPFKILVFYSKLRKQVGSRKHIGGHHGTHGITAVEEWSPFTCSHVCSCCSKHSAVHPALTCFLSGSPASSQGSSGRLLVLWTEVGQPCILEKGGAPDGRRTTQACHLAPELGVFLASLQPLWGWMGRGVKSAPLSLIGFCPTCTAVGLEEDTWGLWPLFKWALQRF